MLKAPWNAFIGQALMGERGCGLEQFGGRARPSVSMQHHGGLDDSTGAAVGIELRKEFLF